MVFDASTGVTEPAIILTAPGGVCYNQPYAKAKLCDCRIGGARRCSDGASGETAARNQYFLLRWYYMRSGPQVDRTTKFLSGAYLPAAKRAGAKTLGFFSPVIGERSPFILAMAVYPSMSALESSEARMAADKDFQTRGGCLRRHRRPGVHPNRDGALTRLRWNSRADGAHPTTASAPPAFSKCAPMNLPAKKLAAAKSRCSKTAKPAFSAASGWRPCFSDRASIGAHLPSLSYMLSYEDLASRDRLWKAFGADPEWQKLRVQPGLSDAEIVSNISNQILRPLNFSEIR